MKNLRKILPALSFLLVAACASSDSAAAPALDAPKGSCCSQTETCPPDCCQEKAKAAAKSECCEAAKAVAPKTNN